MQNIAASFRKLIRMRVLDVLPIQEPCRQFIRRVILFLYSWESIVLLLAANVYLELSMYGDDCRVLEGQVLVIRDNAKHRLSVESLKVAYNVSSSFRAPDSVCRIVDRGIR